MLILSCLEPPTFVLVTTTITTPRTRTTWTSTSRTSRASGTPGTSSMEVSTSTSERTSVIHRTGSIIPTATAPGRHVRSGTTGTTHGSSGTTGSAHRTSRPTHGTSGSSVIHIGLLLVQH